MAFYDLVIIGSGPAGMTAAIYGARANMKVLLLDKLAPGGQIVNTNEIQNYTGTGTINGAELAMNMFMHTQELNVEFDYSTVNKVEDKGDVKVIHIDEDPDRLIETKTGAYHIDMHLILFTHKMPFPFTHFAQLITYGEIIVRCIDCRVDFR